jgi:hypothetical protein
MDRFWRTVSIAMGALLAAGCPVRTKYGIETGEPDDTGETEWVATELEPEGRPLPARDLQLPRAELAE